MPVTVERVDNQEISGWGFDDAELTSMLTVRVRLRGDLICETKVDRPILRYSHFDGGRRLGFVALISNLGDILSAFADGNLTIEVSRDSEEIGGASPPIVATFARHLLSHKTLCSANLLFGNASLEQILERIRVIAAREDVGSQLNGFCFDVIGFIRAYFPSELRPSAFYSLAADLGRSAGMRHAVSFYESQFRGSESAAVTNEHPVSEVEVLGEDQVSVYALPSDLIRHQNLPPIELTLPPFITGQGDASFLLDCGILPKGNSEQPAGCVFGFRVNGFADADWIVDHFDKSVLVAEKLYRVDFETLRRLIDKGSVLLLDMSAEGPPCLPRWIKLLNTALADLGIPASQVLLVTQNLAFASEAQSGRLRAICTTAHYFLKRGSDVANELFGSEAKLLDYIGTLLSRRAQSPNPKKYWTCPVSVDSLSS